MLVGPMSDGRPSRARRGLEERTSVCARILDAVVDRVELDDGGRRRLAEADEGSGRTEA